MKHFFEHNAAAPDLIWFALLFSVVVIVLLLKLCTTSTKIKGGIPQKKSPEP